MHEFEKFDGMIRGKWNYFFFTHTHKTITHHTHTNTREIKSTEATKFSYLVGLSAVCLDNVTVMSRDVVYILHRILPLFSLSSQTSYKFMYSKILRKQCGSWFLNDLLLHNVKFPFNHIHEFIRISMIFLRGKGERWTVK